GLVVGSNTARSAMGLGLAVPINEHTRSLSSSLMREGRVRRAYLGIGTALRPLPPRAATALGRAAGLEVIDVAPGSPAAAAGLRPEDILVAANGQPLTTVEQLQLLLSAETISRPQTLT